LGTDWIGKRVYAPSLEDVVRGAITPNSQGAFHYLTRVRYPAHGGFQAFMGSLVHPESIETEKRVTRVDPWERSLRFADGSEVGYESLISTMPLPELVRAIDPTRVPTDVRLAAGALLCTSLALVDIAVERPDLSPYQWFYSYDEHVSFSRVTFPHALSAANAPPGRGSIQAEVYHSPHRALPCSLETLPGRVVSELAGLGVLRSADEVLWAQCRSVPCANVVFDHQRAVALQTVVPWIEAQGIALAGRYGEWGYHWTDDAVRSGWAAAQRVLRHADRSTRA
ncbi:MAG: protoporphyrinogen/coproporphyrinogen oxidase, partial [bacterium]